MSQQETPEEVREMEMTVEESIIISRTIDENPPTEDDVEEGWFAQHPEDQQYVRFTLDEDNSIVTPLFKELSAEEEQEYREHARYTYTIGDTIDEIFHPVWKDEARKMNSEAGGVE